MLVRLLYQSLKAKAYNHIEIEKIEMVMILLVVENIKYHFKVKFLYFLP